MFFLGMVGIVGCHIVCSCSAHRIVCVKQFSSCCSLFVLEILVYNTIEHNTAACRMFFSSFLWVLSVKSLCSRFFAHTHNKKHKNSKMLLAMQMTAMKCQAQSSYMTILYLPSAYYPFRLRVNFNEA